MTPRQSIEHECRRRGALEVVEGCRELLAGGGADPGLVHALGLDAAPAPAPYWLRVWGVRGLLWNWDDSALPELLAALADEHWRVREMACKVVARHDLDAGDLLLPLRADPVARVRAAATRAVMTAR